jgi:hypothetical protein
MVRSIVAAVVLASGALTWFAVPMQQHAAPPAAQAGPPQIAIPARWLVTFELGPKFDSTKRLQEQAGFMEHVTAIRKLADDGALLVGGPLLEASSRTSRPVRRGSSTRPTSEAVKKLVATDPWVTGELREGAVGPRLLRRYRRVDPGAKPAEKPAGGDAKGNERATCRCAGLRARRATSSLPLRC